MLDLLSGPITVLAAFVTVRESTSPAWATIALSVACVLVVGLALRGEFSARPPVDPD